MTYRVPRPGHRRAVVIGGSLAGLVTARVLTDHLSDVVVIERDTLPSEPAHRRGVPQSHHAHGLLGSGARALADLFPGWLTAMREQVLYKIGNPFAIAEKPVFIMRGTTLVKAPVWWGGGVPGSRILLEHTIRERVAALRNVELRTGVGVTGLLTEGSSHSFGGSGTGRHGQRVIGVSTTAGDVPADLVVDASGRRSKLADWFEELGYPCPRAEVVNAPVHYASCILEPDDDFDPEWVLILGGSVERGSAFRGAVVVPIEDGRYLCTIGAVGTGPPLPVDPADYLETARSLPFPFVAELITRSTMVTPPRRYRVPSNRYLRYDRLRHRPAGVVALGDAVAAFNPIYGQGMSVATRSAVALGRVLGQVPAGVGANTGEFEQRAARAIAAVVRPAWSMALAEDLRAGAQVEGIAGARLRRATEWYRDRLERAAGDDPELAQAFSDVVHLVRTPSSLLTPRIARRVLRPQPRPVAPVPPTTPKPAATPPARGVA